MPTYEATKNGYKNLWGRCKLDPERVNEIDATIARINENLERYWTIETATGVPWFVIAVIHYRESNMNFKGVLHNGEQIIGTGRKTRLVPAGRGPFATWEEAAIDAINYMKLDKVDDWPVQRVLFELERYNGQGYFGKENSPYLWAGTNLSDETGKYVADGKYDPNAPERQLGVAAILKRMTEVDRAVAERLDAILPPIPEPDKEPINLSTIPRDDLIIELTKRPEVKDVLVSYVKPSS